MRSILALSLLILQFNCPALVAGTPDAAGSTRAAITEQIIDSQEAMEKAFTQLEDGQYESSQEYADRLDALKRYIDAQSPESLARWQRLNCWRDEVNNEEEFKRAMDRANNYLSTARQNADQPSTAEMLLCRGWIQSVSGLTDAALADYEDAIQIAEQYPQTRLLGDALSSRGEIRTYLGDLALGVKDLIAAQKNYEASGAQYWGRVNLASIANAYRRIGYYDQALNYYQQLEEAAKELENKGDWINVRSQMALIYEDKGQYGEALTLYTEALNYAIKTQNRAFEASTRLSLAGVQNQLGMHKEGLKNLALAEEFFANSPDTGNRGLLYLFRGQIFNSLNRFPEALSELKKAHSLIQQERNKRFLSWVLKALATAYEGIQEWDRAYIAMKQYAENQNQLDTLLRNQQTIFAQVEFDVARKEADNIKLKAESNQKQQELDAIKELRRWQTAVLLLGSALVLLLFLLILKQVRKNKHLHFLSVTDELTGLPNRRRIFYLGEKLARKALETHAPFSVLVFDVDYFKRINDTFGHASGDAVLKALAVASLEAIRDQDYIGRTGGEEFMALLPGAALDQAVAVAERIRSHIEQHDLSSQAPNLKATVSIGVAQLKKSDGGLDRMIQRADNAMYQAKGSGRNRVVADQ